MIKIMPVDDEPFFISDLSDTINRIGRDYKVVCEAYDAKDALKKIEVNKPDIVFIDIKMPGVDGITLLREVRKRYSYVIPIILSGYHNFSLVREALRAEADDYLLKPIDQEQLNALLKSKTHKVLSLRREAQMELLHSCLNNTITDDNDLAIHFRHPWYFIFLINGNIFQPDSDTLTEITGMLGKANNFWVIDQPSKESVFLLFGLNHADYNIIEGIAAKLLEIYSTSGKTANIVISAPFTDVRSLKAELDKMKNEKDLLQVLGQPLTVLFENKQPSVNKELYHFIRNEYETKLHTALWTHHWYDFQQLVLNTLKTFQEKKISKIFIKKFLYRLTIEVEKNYPLLPQFIEINTENNIERIVEKATGFEMLACEYIDFLMKIFEIDEVNDLADDEKLMSLIDNYLEKNLTKNLNVNKICKHFNISQPKMNRIVKKYKNMSFVTYFTLLKIEKAKRILNEQPKVPINTLAYMLGFSDNLYFSKVFKKVTSYTPTQYKDLFHRW